MDADTDGRDSRPSASCELASSKPRAATRPDPRTLFVLLRRLHCHASGSWRIGIHHVVGTPFVTCRKHHPVVPSGRIGAEQIAQARQGAVDAGSQWRTTTT
jgi:hypothetical protein